MDLHVHPWNMLEWGNMLEWVISYDYLDAQFYWFAEGINLRTYSWLTIY